MPIPYLQKSTLKQYDHNRKPPPKSFHQTPCCPPRLRQIHSPSSKRSPSGQTPYNTYEIVPSPRGTHLPNIRRWAIQLEPCVIQLRMPKPESALVSRSAPSTEVYSHPSPPRESLFCSSPLFTPALSAKGCAVFTWPQVPFSSLQHPLFV